MFPHLKERFKIKDELILELLKNPEYEEIFDDYESMCIQYEQFESDKALHEINHELIAELEEEISIVLSKIKSGNK